MNIADRVIAKELKNNYPNKYKKESRSSLNFSCLLYLFCCRVTLNFDLFFLYLLFR